MGQPQWANLIQVIELGTHLVWAPTTDDRTRATCRTQTRAMLMALINVGRHFDRAIDTAMADDASRTSAPLARGMLFRAKVKEHLDGPDGKYLLLAPLGSDTLVAVQLDDVMQLGGKTGLVDRKDPADGSYVMLCGMATSHFDSGKQQGLFVLPLEWMAIAAPAAATAPANGGPAAKG